MSDLSTPARIADILKKCGMKESIIPKPTEAYFEPLEVSGDWPDIQVQTQCDAGALGEMVTFNYTASGPEDQVRRFAEALEKRKAEMGGEA